jgi:hypothetical protein
MNLISAWLLTYLAPAVAAGAIVTVFARRSNASKRIAIAVHSALVFSAFASQYVIWTTGLTFPWETSTFSIICFLLSILISAIMIRSFAIWYALSALLQQLTMLSVAFLLLTQLPLWSVILLVVPPFVWCHDMERMFGTKMLLFSLWGTSSIALFSFIPNLLLIAAVHSVLGTLLISFRIIHSELAESNFGERQLPN